MRAWANGFSDNTLNRIVMSGVRDLLLAGREEPVDVPIYDGSLHARLYPTTNRCEKRMFVGEHTWDVVERGAIGEALRKADRTRPFVFIDGGANVGMYSLYVIGQARALSWPVQVVAVEPDPINLGRLRDNLAASAAHEASVAPVALGAQAGMVRIESEQTNRGEVRVSETGSVEVPMQTLQQVLTERAIDHVDALKLDIEGHELPVLSAFFEAAPKSLWPRLILLEISKRGETAAYRHCLDHGYALAKRTRTNAMLTLT